MDRLAAMETFVRVADAGSFTAVADQLNVARSAVTRQIAALEGHLGVKLIARSTRRLSLTQDGQAYLLQCRDIIDRISRAEAELGDGNGSGHGLIRATVPMSFGLRHLMPFVARFSELNPQISMDLDFSDRRTDLIEEGYDVGIRITDQLAEAQVARRVCVCRFVVVASPEYLARHGEPRHPNDLRGHECLAYSLALRSGWRFQIDGVVQTINVDGRISANSGDALEDAALRGLGIACQPSFLAADAIRAGTLKRILGEFPIPEISIYAVYPGNRFVPKRVRGFVDFVVDQLAAGSGKDDMPYWDINL